MPPHGLRSDSVCVCYDMLPIESILSIADRGVLHELLCGWLTVGGRQGIYQLVTSVHGWKGIHPGNGCLPGGVYLKQTQLEGTASNVLLRHSCKE